MTRTQWPVEEIATCDLAGGRVLDIGCGPGRHAVELRDRRTDTSGHDLYGTTGAEHLAHHEHSRAAGRLGGQLRIRVRDRHVANGWFDCLMVDADELAEVVEPTRWRLAEVRPGDGSGWLAVIARG